MTAIACIYKVSKSGITKLTVKLRLAGSRRDLGIDSQWGLPQNTVQIFGVTSRPGDTEESARLTRNETPDCRWSTSKRGTERGRTRKRDTEGS